MRSDRAREVERLFHAASDLEPGARAEFLDGLRGTAADLRDEVLSLLAHHETSSEFLGASPRVPSAATPLAAEERFGAFRILRELGRGGMGIVYLAEQEHPRRLVALKVMQPGLAAPSLFKRFEQEALVLARMRHPGIAQVFETGSVDRGAGAEPYFAMEWVEGSSLAEFVAARRLGTRERLALVAEVCDALEHAHRQSVVHRDLKPSNILVDESGDAPRIKVLDFGIARVLDESGARTSLRTGVGQVIGTVPYMSPEQASGEMGGVDPRSDVYSLGVIAYELLCGRLPLDVAGKPLHDAVRIVCEQDPTPISRLVPVLRGDVETILLKSLEKRRERRYASAAALAGDIRRHLADRPIDARPPSRAYLLQKFARRHRGAVVALASLFAALGAGFAATAYAALVAARERDAAQVSADLATRAAKRAAAVARFQREMLSRVQPELDGRDVRLAAVLDAARAELPGDLAGDPASEGAVRKTLGDSYAALGLLEEAEAELRLACSQLETGLGTEAREFAEAIAALSSLRADRGDLAEAIELAERAQALFAAHRESAPAEALVHELNLAQLWNESGRAEDAERLARANLAARKALLGEQSPLYANGLQALGDLVGRRARYVEAAELLREAERRALAYRAADHPDAVRLSAQLATVLRLSGDLDAAEARFARTMETGERVFGADHFELFSWRNNYAGLLEQRGRLAEAEAIYLDLLERMPRVLGEDHEGTRAVRANLEGLRRKRR